MGIERKRYLLRTRGGKSQEINRSRPKNFQSSVSSLVKEEYKIFQKKDLYFLSDHKTGFSISRKISEMLDNQVETRTFLRFWHECDPNHKYVVFIRHPYEIITSGYNYHRKCNEDWALEDKNMFWWWLLNHFTKESIEKNKEAIEFANFSKEKPYRDILNSLPALKGIEYEMTKVGYLTVMGLYEYPNYGKENVMVVRMEDLKEDITSVVGKIIDFFNIEGKAGYLKKIEDLDLKKMSNEKIIKDDHITNKKNVEFMYKKMWDKGLYKKANDIFPSDLLEKLGYTK